NRPYIVCHMASTINGRIISENWGRIEDRRRYSALYEQCHNSFENQAWMVGRKTLEKDFNERLDLQSIKPSPNISREAFIGDPNATSFVIALDSKGKLGWDSNEIDGDHVIVILTEDISNDYLNYLKLKNISYVFAGKNRVSFKVALEKIGELFPIRTIMLEGGGHINGAMLQEDLIDEISIVLLPVIDATSHSPTTFEIPVPLHDKENQNLSYQSVEQLDNGVLWLKYSIDHS
ncbi:MAG: RibD family protein, partial [Pedobacter sp.]